MRWTINVACEKIMQQAIDERNKAPKCELCNCVGFDYIQYLNEYLPYLEIKKKVITFDMYKIIYEYFWDHYPFHYDPGNLARHHLNYEKDICVYVCGSCHGKIHHNSNPEYIKYKPVDKKPKNKKLNHKMYKSLNNLYVR